MANITIGQLKTLPKAAEITEIVSMPEWGEGTTVTIRALSLVQRDSLMREARRENDVDTERWNALVLMYGFADPVLEYDDAVQVLQMAHEPVLRLINRIWQLSGLTPEGQISKAVVDDAEATFRG